MQKQELRAAASLAAGVAEALVVPEEGLAYLKVDSKTFDRAKAESVAGATLEPF